MDKLKKTLMNKSIILENLNEERKRINARGKEINNLIDDIKRVFDKEVNVFKNFKSWKKMGDFFKEEVNLFKKEHDLIKELAVASEGLKNNMIDLRRRLNELYEKNNEANSNCLETMEYFKKQKSMFMRR